MFLYASAENYPGGEAIVHLQHTHRFMRNKQVRIHIDEYCAQSGITRFLQLYDSWEYNKTEGMENEELQGFDYLIVGSPTKEHRDQITRNFSLTHKEYFSIKAFNRIKYVRPPDFFYSIIKKLPYFFQNYLKLPQVDFSIKVVVFKKK